MIPFYSFQRVNPNEQEAEYEANTRVDMHANNLLGDRDTIRL